MNVTQSYTSANTPLYTLDQKGIYIGTNNPVKTIDCCTNIKGLLTND